MTTGEIKHSIIECILRVTDGERFVDVNFDGVPYCSYGPFEDDGAHQSFYQFVLNRVRSQGGEDIPAVMQ